MDYFNANKIKHVFKRGKKRTMREKKKERNY